MASAQFIIELVNDPAESAQLASIYEQLRLNADWLETHWPDLVPRALGKLIAVAGQEAFVADSAKEAWEWAETQHANDLGTLVEYVLPAGGPRFYANRR